MLLGRGSCHSERLIPNWCRAGCCTCRLVAASANLDLLPRQVLLRWARGAPLVIRPAGALLEALLALLHTLSHFSLPLLAPLPLLALLLCLFKDQTGAYAPRGAERSLLSPFGLFGGRRRGRTFELLGGVVRAAPPPARRLSSLGDWSQPQRRLRNQRWSGCLLMSVWLVPIQSLAAGAD